MLNDEQHLQRVADIAGISIPPQARPLHQQVILRERRFHYQQWGDVTLPPLLFLHGGNQTSHTWDVVCAALSTQYNCVALDQRGHGDSEWSYEGDYRASAQAEDISALVQHLEWSRYTIIGMSMGGFNAMYYAAEHSKDLNGLVIIDTGPFVDFNEARKISSFVISNNQHKQLEDYVDAAMAHNPRRRRELLQYSMQRNLRRLPDGSWTWKADRRDNLQHEKIKQDLEALPERLHKITCPVLIMRGGESEILTQAHAERFCNALNNARWIAIEDAGHAIQGDNPKGLLRELRIFLAQLRNSDTHCRAKKFP